MSSPLFSAVEYFFESLYKDVVDVSEDEMVGPNDYDVAADSIEELFKSELERQLPTAARSGGVDHSGMTGYSLPLRFTIPHDEILKEIADSYTSEFEWAINLGEESLKDALMYNDDKIKKLFEILVKKYIKDSKYIKDRFKFVDEAAGDDVEFDLEFDDDIGGGIAEVMVYLRSDPGVPRRSRRARNLSRIGREQTMKTITASDRKNLIRLAASLPKGDKQRLAILTGLKSASIVQSSGGMGKPQSADPRKSDKKLLESIKDLRRMKTSNAKKTAVRAEDDHGDEILDLGERVRDTIKELESLLKRSKDFQKRLQSGRLKGGDYFLDFTPAMDDGYDRTGPKEIIMVD